MALQSRTTKMKLMDSSFLVLQFSLQTQPLKSSGTVVLKSTVTDSRGQKATLSKNIAVTEWYSTVKNVSAQRWNVSTNKADDEGTAVKITYSFSIAPVANKNDKTVMIQ